MRSFICYRGNYFFTVLYSEPVKIGALLQVFKENGEYKAVVNAMYPGGGKWCNIRSKPKTATAHTLTLLALRWLPTPLEIHPSKIAFGHQA